MPKLVSLGDLSETALAAIASPAIDKLDDIASTVPELSDALEQAFGVVPHLRIDITDPPSPVVVTALGLELAGELGEAVDRVTRKFFAGVAGTVRNKRAAAIAKIEELAKGEV